MAWYERAWRTRGTDLLAELFTADATYLQGPYESPVVGLDAIAAMWERERDGADEAFSMTSEITAVDGETAVVRLEVHYEQPARDYRDLWLIEFDADGRCRSFEEWPFAPRRR